MEAIYYGNCTSWWAKDDKSHIPTSWHGPILMADLEAGMYGGNDVRLAHPSTRVCSWLLVARNT